MTETALDKLQALPPPPPPLAGLGVAAVVAAAIAGWVALGSMFLSGTSLFAGFMILWYWAKVEHLATAGLPRAVLGALVGIGVSWAMLHLGQTFGGGGIALGLLLLFVAIYLDIVQVMPLLFNASTMLFSIVSAAPLIQLQIDWIEFGLSTAIGGLYFGAFVAGVMWLASKRSPKPD